MLTPQHSSVDPVFQIGLISALSAAVLLLSLLWAARQRVGVGTPPEARRVLVALDRAGTAALRRRAATLPVAVAVGLLLLLVAQWILSEQAPGAHPRNTVLGVLLIVVGAATGLAVALMTVRHIRTTAYASWDGLCVSTVRAIGSTWTNATTLLIVAEASGVLCVLAANALVRAIISDSNIAPANEAAAQLTGYFGVGAAISALWLQQMGAACLGATCLGADAAFAAQTGLPEGDARNPGVLVDSVSRQLGEVIPAVLDAFLASCLLATLTLLLLNDPTAREFFPVSPALATFPLLLRAFGLLSSFFAVVSLRAAKHESIVRSVGRSHWVGVIVLASAVVGTIAWLVGITSPHVLVAGLFGLLLPTTLAQLRTFARSQVRSTQGAHAAPAGEAAALLRVPTTGHAFQWIAWLPMSAYALATIGAVYLLAKSELEVAAVAILVGLALPISLSSFHGTARVAMATLGTTRLAVKLGRVTTSDVADRSTLRLTCAFEQLSLRFDSVISDSSLLLCALVALVIGIRGAPTSPGIAVSGAFGAVLLVSVLAFTSVGQALSTGGINARALSFEVERQLRGLPREGLLVRVPEDFVPSYRSAVELLARNASRGGLLTTTLAIALPLLAAVAGRGTENTPGSPATLLAMYVSVAAAVGLAALHLGQAAPLASSLANRHRVGRLPAGTELEVSTNQPGLVDFLRRSTAFSIPLLTKATTLVALALAAMLS